MRWYRRWGRIWGAPMIYPALVSGGSLHIIMKRRGDGWRELGEYFEAEGIDY